MKKNKILKPLPIIFNLLILLSFSFIFSSFSNFCHSIQYDFFDFKNKPYYFSLFSNPELTSLNEADELYEKGKTYMIEADDNFRKAEGYKKMDETNGKTDSKKADKYEKKAIKIALKAYENYLNAIDIKFHVYSQKLSNTKSDNGKRHLKAEEYAIDAKSFFLNGTEILSEAKNLKGFERIELLKNAYNEQIRSIEKQEIAFMLFMNDPDIKDINHIENNDEDTETDQDIAENDTYEPGKDPNVYISKEDIIVEALNMSDSDIKILKDVSEKVNLADLQMKEIDEEYQKIDQIRKEAETIEDEYDRTMKLKLASGLEEVLFDKMIETANLYYEADKTKYEVYIKYLPKARNNNDEENSNKFDKNAFKLHSDASKLYNKTKFNSDSKTNQYIMLMNAVQTELSAIQELENAFSIYFEQEPEPLEIITEVMVDEDDNQTGKTLDINNKLSYNYSGSFYYSHKVPKPQPLVIKEGIVFKVQIGLFKELLSLKEYGKYSPISFDTFKNSPYKRFMLGEYISNKSAELVLEKMKAKGFTDAFIVAFENGERKTLTYGITKLIRNTEFEKIETQEIDHLTGKTEINSDILTENKTEFKEISKTQGLVWLIQLGNYSTTKTKEDFKGINQIYTDYSDNSSYKYLSGIYKSYDEAKKNIAAINEKGFKDVFITSYYHGKRISINEALKLNQNNNISSDSKTDIYFTVQIGLFSHKLTVEELKQFDEIEKKYPITVSDSGSGLYLYSAGHFNTYDEANTAKTVIKSLKFDSFIIAFKNGEKIPASDAVIIQKKN